MLGVAVGSAGAVGDGVKPGVVEIGDKLGISLGILVGAGSRIGDCDGLAVDVGDRLGETLGLAVGSVVGAEVYGIPRNRKLSKKQ